jgi:hypothetical protein
VNTRSGNALKSVHVEAGFSVHDQTARIGVHVRPE